MYKLTFFLIFSGDCYSLAAAACIATLFVGSLGSVVAEPKHNCFFYWLSRDKTGVSFVTTPASISDTAVINSSAHYEDVPAEYQQYVVNVGDFDFLEGFESEGVEIYTADNNSGSDSVHNLFRNTETGNTMMIAVTIYPHRSFEARENYDSKAGYRNYGYYIDGNGVRYTLLSKSNSLGSMDYVVLFYFGDKRYDISYVDDLDLLLEAARTYQSRSKSFRGLKKESGCKPALVL